MGSENDLFEYGMSVLSESATLSDSPIDLNDIDRLSSNELIFDFPEKDGLSGYGILTGRAGNVRLSYKMNGEERIDNDIYATDQDGLLKAVDYVFGLYDELSKSSGNFLQN